MFHLFNTVEYLLKEAKSAICRNVYVAARILTVAIGKTAISADMVCEKLFINKLYME